MLLVDPKKNNVITLYKIDLNLGDDFNKEYVSRMLEKINNQKAIIEERRLAQSDERAKYSEHIAENEETIKGLRKTIKELEEMNESYKTLINNMLCENSAQDKELSNLINTLISKNTF